MELLGQRGVQAGVVDAGEDGEAGVDGVESVGGGEGDEVEDEIRGGDGVVARWVLSGRWMSEGVSERGDGTAGM